MASTKLAFLAVAAILLLQAPWCAVSQQDAVMVWTSFEESGGSGPTACDGRYYNDGDPIVALSTEWFANGIRCLKGVIITSKDTGKTVGAVVVDEVDEDNTIAASTYIWQLLGFENTYIGEVGVTWVDGRE